MNLEHCCRDIKTWMAENKLKLNDDKAEVLLLWTSISLKGSTATMTDHVHVVKSQISLCQPLPGMVTGH